MISNSEKSAFFLDEINKEADRQCSKIKTDVDRYISAELQKARQSAKNDVKILQKDEIDRLNEENNAKLSYVEATNTRQLVEHRKNLTDVVFDEAKKKIIEFTEKYNYLLFLKKSIENIKSEIGEDAVIFVRENDRKYEDELLTVCKGLEYDNSIILGGCKGKNVLTKLTADDTLDLRYSKAKENFYSYSNLSITL